LLVTWLQPSIDICQAEMHDAAALTSVGAGWIPRWA
jgi:hypothetical protein